MTSACPAAFSSGIPISQVVTRAARQELYKEWRERWLMGGMRWNGGGEDPPENWNPVEQLRRIGVEVARE